MEERYTIVDIFVTESDSEFSEIIKTRCMLDMYRVESFYATVDDKSTIVSLYSGDSLVVAMPFNDFERIFRQFAGGKVQVFA